MDGIITFFSSHQVIKAEKILIKNGFRVLLIPGPREISPNCGVELCFEFYEAERASLILKNHNVIFEAMHYYPEVEKVSKWL